MTDRSALVTGLGCLCAAGASVDEAVASLYAGRRHPAASGRVPVDLDRAFPVFEVASDLRSELAGLDALADFGGICDVSDASRTSALALLAAVEACRHAGLGLSALRGMRVGVAVGTTVGCTLNNEPFYRSWRAGEYPGLDAVDRFISNNPALFLVRALGLRGPVATIDNACSSGTDAIGLARDWLAAGRCDAVLAGGADELSRVTCLGFASLMIASDEPCRPFDLHRKGLNLGEGAGMMVIERADAARLRGAHGLAHVAGYATCADAHHPTAPHPEGRGLRRALGDALREAQAAPGMVAFVNAHGTSTPDNDRVEGGVLADVIGRQTPVVSTKAFTGHTLGAAGGVEAVFAVRNLLDGRVPAMAGFAEADPACCIEPTRETVSVSGEFAVSNSLAFGGNNSVLVFRRAQA